MDSAVPEYPAACFSQDTMVGKEVSTTVHGAIYSVTAEIVGHKHVHHKIEEAKESHDD